MRVFAFLAILVVTCNSMSIEQLKEIIEDGTLDGISSLPSMPSIPNAPEDNAVNRILLIIWTELNDISEQMKELTQTTITLQVTTDNLQSALFLLTNRIVNVESALEGE